MLLLNYTLKRIQSIIDQIDFLMGSEFPYRDSKDALIKLKKHFNDHKITLESLYNQNEYIVKQTCTDALDALFTYLPLMGFILRSTNTRNAFEYYRPLLRLSNKILNIYGDRNIRLVLSSEWTYSPFTYWAIPGFIEFIFIGLPAHESGNPLLLPLVGHELGHHIWKINDFSNKTSFVSKIRQSIINCIINEHWKEYITIFSGLGLKEPDDILSNYYIFIPTIYLAESLALKQAEETFCDFIALRIFGRAYLCAFAYLLSPNYSWERAIEYPNMKVRVSNLLKAATNYKFDYEANYNLLFDESVRPSLTDDVMLQLALSDGAMQTIIDVLIEMADKIIGESYTTSDKREIDLIKKRFEKIVPAEKCKNIVDIINSGWDIYDSHLKDGSKIWDSLPHIDGDKQDKIFKDLILKNIEVFEIEQILQKTDIPAEQEKAVHNAQNRRSG